MVGSKSFFTEIIASISDIKFARDGRHILSRDYMTLKVCVFCNINFIYFFVIAPYPKMELPMMHFCHVIWCTRSFWLNISCNLQEQNYLVLLNFESFPLFLHSISTSS